MPPNYKIVHARMIQAGAGGALAPQSVAESGTGLAAPDPAVGAAGTAAAAGLTANATSTAAPSRAAGKQQGEGQSNLEKLLDQLKSNTAASSSGASSSSSGGGGGGGGGLDEALLSAAAKAQPGGEAAKQLAMNYVAVAGCTPEDGKELTRMVEGECA
jgi:hypothetical protein